MELFARPTPVERAPRLAEAIGLRADDLWLKRDDLIGLGGGGNKVRKLEVSLRAVLAAGATRVVTTGAAQSNHARLTAAAGARCGLEVVLVLWGDDPGARTGNLLLDDLFGARLEWAGRRDAEAVADELAAEPGSHRIPYGGSSVATAEAYADAGREVLAQVPGVRHVVTAVGSGGTMAGLVRGLGVDRVLGVHTGAVDDPRAAVQALLGPDTAIAPDELRIRTDQVGAGYSTVTDAVRRAVRLAARTQGVVLDPVYTGRALSGLAAEVADGVVTPGETTVFVHTGGLPGLFGAGAWS